MHSTFFFIPFLLALTTFVRSAPTASLSAATLLNNAQEAQQLNAQFQSANSTATGSCTNGEITCVQDAIASCVNGQFDASNGRCPAAEQCFAIPSVKSSGTIITCTSEKSAQSLINAAGATGEVTGSGSGGSVSSVNPASESLSFTSSGATATETALDMNHITVTTTVFASPPTVTVASNQSVVTGTATLIPLITTPLSSMFTTTLPSVTETLSAEQAASLLSSLLAEGGLATATSNFNGSDAPSETVTSTVSATATDIPTPTPDSNPCLGDGLSSEALSSTVSASATNIPSSTSPSAVTPVAVANNSTSLGSGGYNGY